MEKMDKQNNFKTELLKVNKNQYKLILDRKKHKNIHDYKF